MFRVRQHFNNESIPLSTDAREDRFFRGPEIDLSPVSSDTRPAPGSRHLHSLYRANSYSWAYLNNVIKVELT